MRKAQDLIDWIIFNTDHKDSTTAEPAAIFFVATQEAAFIHCANTIKDTARMLLDGLPPINMKYVQGWLDQKNEENEEAIEENLKPFDFEETLKQHFGV